MNRIDRTFARLKEEGRKGLVGYLTAGDPDRAASEVDICSAIEQGIDVLELGIPFSDPTADGPVIQEASQRALAAGMDVAGTLEIVRRMRQGFDLPIVLFGYANPLFKYGYAKVCADAADAGADAMLVVDMPFEEAGELRSHMDRHGLYYIPLIAPTTPGERAARILKDARGFVYYIMVTGVTGAREVLAGDISGHVQDLRRCTDLPIAVGFGVGSGEQARAAVGPADAVVVGSAMIKAARSGRLGEFVAELRGALDRAEA